MITMPKRPRSPVSPVCSTPKEVSIGHCKLANAGCQMVWPAGKGQVNGGKWPKTKREESRCRRQEAQVPCYGEGHVRDGGRRQAEAKAYVRARYKNIEKTKTPYYA